MESLLGGEGFLFSTINHWHNKVTRDQKYDNLISSGAIVALAGYLLSGPVAFVLVRLISPQPQWESAAVFSQNYHVIQDVPYYFGFFLITGMLMISAGHYLNFKQSGDANSTFMILLALCSSIIFSGLISFNYICQITFVRKLAIDYRPEYDPAIAIFSMANTRSLTWAIEMWGYAFLGAATTLLASYYKNRNNLLTVLLVVNGIVSLGSAVFTIADVSWVMTSGGLICYFGWNVLMILIMSLIYRESATARTRPAIA